MIGKMHCPQPYFMVKGRCSYQLATLKALSGAPSAARRNIRPPLNHFEGKLRLKKKLKTITMPASDRSYSTLPDQDLLTLIQESDHAAYTELYKRYHIGLISFAYKKVQDEELAKDIVQDLFVKLWDKRQTLILPPNPNGYFLNAVKHAIFNQFVHQSVESKYIASLADYSNTGTIAHTDHLVREREWNSIINAAIAKLPRKMRQAFLLNKKENLSYAETAKRLNTTENNIQKHINSAIKILKTKLML